MFVIDVPFESCMTLIINVYVKWHVTMIMECVIHDSRDAFRMDVDGLWTNISWTSATVSFKICGCPLVFHFSTLLVSINVFNHCFMGFTGGGGFPYFIRYFRCTVIRDFDSISQLMHWPFSWIDAIVLKQKLKSLFEQEGWLF